MADELKQADVEKWLEKIVGDFHINDLRKDLGVEPTSSRPRVHLHRLCETGIIKPSGKRDGWYRKVQQIVPIKWWNGEEMERIKLLWPSTHSDEDYSGFGFEDTIEIFPGDSLVVAGDSNWGKTALVLNLLVDNLHLFEGARLMVNEYKPQRFRNRMKRFTWVDFWNEEGPKFELLPVMKDHIDYIKPDYLNIIDWLHIKNDFWDVASQIEAMQMQLRGGILIAVLQKTTGKKMGVGGDWGKFFPAGYFTLSEPGVMYVEKVKSAPMGQRKPEGKKFAYDIIEGGSKFHNIREVRTCPSCKGNRYSFGHPCDKCEGRGYCDNS